MEPFQMVLSLSLSDRSCDNGEKSQSKVLDDLHDTQTGSQQAGLDNHGDSGHNDSAENRNTDSEQGSGNPSDPFDTPEFSTSFEVHHKDVSKKNEATTDD